MSSSLLLAALKLFAATSVAVALCALLRKPLRHLSGARAAYWLWLLVPVSAGAVLLPVPDQPLQVFMRVLPAAASVSQFFAHAQLGMTPARNVAALLAVALWALGVLLAAALVLRAQWKFRRGLEPLEAGPGAAARSGAIAGPMLVGTWRPRVVLPADFDARYTAVERELVLAHEYTHLRRRDPLMNACAAATLCMNWFNPLLYWGLSRFRFDQELACDAAVLTATGARRRCYADALLKTHLANDSRGASNWLIPVGCPWQPTHPLTERIAMLKLPLPGTLRRRVGAGVLVVVIGSAGYACWAAQAAVGPARQVLAVAAAGAPVALHMKWIINDADTSPAKANEVTRSRTVLIFNVVVPAGKEVELTSPGKTLAARCTPTLSGPAGHGDSSILVRCALTSHGNSLGTPSVLMEDGGHAALEVADPGRRASRLEINASTRPRDITAVSEDEAGSAEDADAAGDAPDPDDAPDVDAPDAPDMGDAPQPPEPPEPPQPAAAHPHVKPI